MYPLISVIINYDSTRAITTTYADENEYWVKQYSLETYELCWQEKIGGGKNDFMKCKEVEQSPNGDRYVIAYNNDGAFHLRLFDKHAAKNSIERDERIIIKNTVDVNLICGIKKNNTICHNSFHDPYITVTFIS